MRYLALAADYDETLAASGRPSAETVSSLEKLRSSGRRLILLTGRTLEQLQEDCAELALFDCVVVENGGVLHVPSSRTTNALCPSTAVALAPHLERRGVTPLVVGRTLLATSRPHEGVVLEALRDQGLELQIIFNGEAVLVLPSGVNKGSGLRAALSHLGLSVHEVVGIGSSANDHSFLELCECSFAVANALPSIKQRADFCTRAPRGEGVSELIDELVGTDLHQRTPGGGGDVIVLGTRDDGPVTFLPYGQNILVSGPSSAGKSTFATGLIERLMDRDYQLCIIDPEGDYGTLDEIVTVGNRLRAPTVDDILERLADASANVVANLLGIELSRRPDFFSQLFPRLQALRARTGRPHWILIDEVHHLLPRVWGLAHLTLPQRLGETILITHQPRQVAPSILTMVDIVVAVGPEPDATLAEYAEAIGISLPEVPDGQRGYDEVTLWQRTAGGAPRHVRVVAARSERLRHLRKYAEGNLGPRSFFFRGPHGKLNLKAVNLVSFCDMAAGVDDDTWLFHLHRGDYSHWLRRVIKDEDLAREVAGIAEARKLLPSDSRQLVREAIDRRYMLPH